MTMSKRDFKAIAAALAHAKPIDDPIGKMVEQWCNDVKAIAGGLAITNRNFNTDRFLEACTYHGGES